MDYISYILDDHLVEVENESNRQNSIQETTFLYLLRALTSEIWWRLRSASGGSQELAALQSELQHASHNECLKKLKKSLSSAISNPTLLEQYQKLIDKLSHFNRLRNTQTHDFQLRLTPTDLETMQERGEILKEIYDQGEKGELDFPPLDNSWKSLVPIRREGETLVCLVFEKKSGLTRAVHYGWSQIKLDAGTPELCRSDCPASDTTLQEGRLYYYRPPANDTFGSVGEICCAYPFVQINLPPQGKEMDSIWLFNRLCFAQSGECEGTDLLNRDFHWYKKDHRLTPELRLMVNSDQNPYLSIRESTGSAHYPIRNIYELNYAGWCDLWTADDVTKKVKSYLRKGSPIIYVYGPGGVGKTAAIQRMLETFGSYEVSSDPDRNSAYMSYDFLIFLSAKKQEWKNSLMLTDIDYDKVSGMQHFSDYESLRQALRNIFRIPDEAEPEAVHFGAEDKHLFDGKNILLVLDDLESVEREVHSQIITYLENNFLTRATDRQRRQVIITSRTTPSEGYSANVQMSPLDSYSTARFARFMAGLCQCEDQYTAALGTAESKAEAGNITQTQKGNRQKLQSLTGGKPLLIRALVFGRRDADFSSIHMAKKALLDYLIQNTYHYLGTPELKRLAAIAAYMTIGNISVLVSRLETVWKLDDTGNLSDMLNTLRNYGIINYENRENNTYRTFSLANPDMREYIIRSFKCDKAQDLILSPSSVKIAKWLSKYQTNTAIDCLLLHLRGHVRQWYVLHNREAYWADQLHGTASAGEYSGDPGEVLTDIVLLLNTIQKMAECKPHQRRAAIQVLAQICKDFPQYLEPDAAYSQQLREAHYVIPASDLHQYHAELFRSMLGMYTAQSIQNEYLEAREYVLNQLRMCTSAEKDHVMILWAVMLLIEELNRVQLPLYSELSDALLTATQPGIQMLFLLAPADQEIFLAKMHNVIELLAASEGQSQDALALLRIRCREWDAGLGTRNYSAAIRLCFGG